ncbi:glycosyltransferase [Weissella confusa]|uniref:glycosyltransferase n=1 Tax=Weissella confusa TaxID=1583 RepID=UPI002A762D2C|nr:glycosyltransferase [Weissella confusa]MDY2522492.1 glycosyltransferase [Weissella confusa]
MNVLITSAAANMIWQFNTRNIEILKSIGMNVFVATNFEKPGTISLNETENFKKWLEEHNILYQQIDFERGVGSIEGNVKAYKQLKNFTDANQIDVIYSQSPIGGVISRLVGWKLKKTNVYMAHGFHFFKGAPLLNWILFYPIEYLLSFVTDVLLVINDEDLRRANKMHARKVQKVPGVGVNMQKFLSIDRSSRLKIRNEIRHSFEFKPEDFVILNVGELSKRKNQKMLLKAVAELNDKNIKVMMAGIGPEKNNLQELAYDLGIDNQVLFLGFRDDISKLHYAADVNVFPSKQEGLALGGLESVMNGLYILGSDVRGIRDYIIDDTIGKVFNMHDTEGLKEQIRFVKENRPRVSDEAVQKLSDFDSSNVDETMKKIFEEI